MKNFYYGSVILYSCAYLGEKFQKFKFLFDFIAILCALLFGKLCICVVLGGIFKKYEIQKYLTKYSKISHILFVILSGIHFFIFLKLKDVQFANFIEVIDFMLAYFAVFSVFTSERVKNILEKFKSLGKISFAVYLIHWPVICSFSCRIFLKFYDKIPYKTLFCLTFIVSAALILAMSFFFAKFTEPVIGKIINIITDFLKGKFDEYIKIQKKNA